MPEASAWHFAEAASQPCSSCRVHQSRRASRSGLQSPWDRAYWIEQESHPQGRRQACGTRKRSQKGSRISCKRLSLAFPSGLVVEHAHNRTLLPQCQAEKCTALSPPANHTIMFRIQALAPGPNCASSTQLFLTSAANDRNELSGICDFPAKPWRSLKEPETADGFRRKRSLQESSHRPPRLSENEPNAAALKRILKRQTRGEATNKRGRERGRDRIEPGLHQRRQPESQKNGGAQAGRQVTHEPQLMYGRG